jgi:hypothetical protein
MRTVEWTNQAFRRFAGSKIPFSVFMRWVVVIGIAIRGGVFYIQSPSLEIRPWLVSLAGYFIYALAISILLVRHPENQKRRVIFIVQLALDTLFCSLFFYLGDTVNSDLYLNFALPLVIILENCLEAFSILAYYFLVCGALLIVMVLLTKYCETNCTYSHVILHSYLPRVVLGICIMIFAILRNLKKP